MLCSMIWLSALYLRYWPRNEWLLVSQRQQGATDFSLRAKVARNANLTSQLNSPCHAVFSDMVISSASSILAEK